ncbi:MAG TPA: hypothetical protein VGP99_11360, partial [Tepidisphaeraceae bacterium]|nr:hypothetical protein [Tepidisphaeraceae bacterium]
KKAQAQARSLNCLSNLRQMHYAFSMYNNDCRGKAFFYRADYPTFWMSQLLKYQGKNARIRLCPETTEPSFGWGSTFEYWGPDFGNPWMQDHKGSYCYNGWLYRLFPDKSGGGQQYSGGGPDYYFNLPTKDTANIPVFADSTWVDAWPKETDPPPPNPYTSGTATEVMMWRVAIPRHYKGTNVVFLDGHASHFALGELWKLQWSRKFIPRDNVKIKGF